MARSGMNFTCLSLLLASLTVPILMLCGRTLEDDRENLSSYEIQPKHTYFGREAYVTFLYKTVRDESYREGFEIGVRVLGQSLRESGTTKEYVVLCAPDVPKATKNVLATDGWIVKEIDGFAEGESKHFDSSILKFNAWLLEEYRRVVYLDSDTIVVRNVDELFKCGVFCAAYRNSDLFNAGVLVLKPSTEQHKIIKTYQCPNKNKCVDQLLLNIHFSFMKYSPLFNKSTLTYHEEPLRLPWIYNGDIGLYYVNGHWSDQGNDVKIIHYTLGYVKPMQWWTYPLFDLNWRWNKFRENLPFRFNEPSILSPLSFAPFVIVLLLYFLVDKLGYFFKIIVSNIKVQTSIKHLFVPGEGGWIATAFPVVAQTASYVGAFLCVPTVMRPKEAFVLYGIWTTFFIILQYTIYYTFVCVAVDQRNSKLLKGKAKCITIFYLLFFVMIYFLSIYIPYITFPFLRRLLISILMIIISYVYGYFTGRHLLKIWTSQ